MFCCAFRRKEEYSDEVCEMSSCVRRICHRDSLYALLKTYWRLQPIVSHRRTRDCLFLLVLAAFWGGMIFIAYSAFTTGVRSITSLLLPHLLCQLHEFILSISHQKHSRQLIVDNVPSAPPCISVPPFQLHSIQCSSSTSGGRGIAIRFLHCPTSPF